MKTPDHIFSAHLPAAGGQSLRRRLLLAGAAAALWPQARADGWPGKPVKITVAYPPGGVADVTARLLAERLSPLLGQRVVVDNKAGASGVIGMDAVAKAAPDGYSLGICAISPLVISPHLGKMPFDAARDIAPVASIMASPVLLLGTPALAARDFKALLAQAKAHPDKVRWATAGQGSLGHIVLEQVQAGTQARFAHIPYKGGGQQINDALGGQFEVLSTNAGPATIGHVQAGKLHALAVGSPQRLDALPHTPTLAELGLPQANVASAFGLFAPAGTPAAVLARLNAEINRLLQDADIRARITASGNLPTGGSADSFAQQIARESAANAQVIRAAGIRAD